MTEPDNNNKVEKVEEPVISAGEMLRNAREARNFSQQDIATRLRLKIEVIKALELDQYGNLEAPIFVRGYIRSYAMQVGVSPEEVVEAFNRIVGEPEAPPIMKQPSVGKIKNKKIPSNSPIPSILFAVISILILIGLVWWYLQGSHSNPGKESSLNTEQNTLPPAEKKLEIPPVSGADEKKPDSLALPPTESTDGNAVSPGKAESVAVKPEIPAPVVKPVRDKSTVKPVVARAGEQLVIRCTGDSWVEIRDASDKRLLYRLVKKNETVEISGKAPFSLLFGNAAGISIELNGKPYDFSRHVHGKVARFRLDKE